jgi:hypothetical protein
VRVTETFVARAATSLAVVVIGLALTHCASGDDDAGTGVYVPVLCGEAGATTDCKISTDAGRCADKPNAKCDLLTNQCVYRLSMAASLGDGCVCVENEARVCDLDAGVLGVKSCQLQSGPSGTRWGACQALNP